MKSSKFDCREKIETILNDNYDLVYCVHTVNISQYEVDSREELQRLLDKCHFVPGSPYIFFFSGQIEDLSHRVNHLLANLYLQAIMMDKTLITDLTWEKLCQNGYISEKVLFQTVKKVFASRPRSGDIQYTKSTING